MTNKKKLTKKKLTKSAPTKDLLTLDKLEEKTFKRVKRLVTRAQFEYYCKQLDIDNLQVSLTLTEDQELWCREYVNTKNQTEASRRVYPDIKSHYYTGCKLLRKQNIRLRIAQLWFEETERLGMTPVDVLDELAAIAKADLTDYIEVDKYGNEKLRKGANGKAIKSYRKWKDESGITRVDITFWNKDRALENYGRYHKMFTDGIVADVKTTVQEFKIGNNTIEF